MLPPRWRDPLTATALYALALAARLPFVGVRPHTPEGAHLVAAQTLASKSTFVYFLYAEVPVELDVLFWGRPLFFLMLAPAAPFGFEGTRMFLATLAALAAPLVFLILRRLGARAVVAASAGITVAVAPYFAVWTTFLLPDAIATVFMLTAFLFFLNDRPLLAGAFALAGAWVKEIAVIVTVAMLVASVLQERSRGVASFWPLRLGKASTALAGATLAAPLPLAVSLVLGGRFPGWGRGGEGLIVVDRLTLIGWFWFLLVAGLAWRRTRMVSAIALTQVVFYLAYRFVFGRTIEIWYHVMPATFAIVAAFLFLDEAANRIRESSPRTRPLAYLPAFFAFLVVLVLALAPFDAAGKGVALRPFTRTTSDSFFQTIQYEEGRSLDLEGALDAVGSVDVLFSIDLDWSDNFYPAGDHADRIVFGITSWLDFGNFSLRPWAEMIEEKANLSIIQRIDHPATFAILDTYRDCIVYENPKYAVIDGRSCKGRLSQLEERIG